MALDPIKVGVEAPDFELPSSELGSNGKPGKVIRLSDYRGKKVVVLAFYPLDFSPVCTSENQCFQKTTERYAAADAQMLGISVDSAWAHAAFAQQLGLEYPLLADFHPKGEVARKYGLYLEESGITARATVVVGKDGLVKLVQVQQIPEPRANLKLLEFVEALAKSG
jgi:peroxiredoxin